MRAAMAELQAQLRRCDEDDDMQAIDEQEDETDEKSAWLVCNGCGLPLVKEDEIIEERFDAWKKVTWCYELSVLGREDVPCYSATNAHDHRFDVVRVLPSPVGTGIKVRGAPTPEYSWFPGFSWQMAHCARCNRHLGWAFSPDPKEETFAVEPGKCEGEASDAIVTVDADDSTASNARLAVAADESSAVAEHVSDHSRGDAEAPAARQSAESREQSTAGNAASEQRDSANHTEVTSTAADVDDGSICGDVVATGALPVQQAEDAEEQIASDHTLPEHQVSASSAQTQGVDVHMDVRMRDDASITDAVSTGEARGADLDRQLMEVDHVVQQLEETDRQIAADHHGAEQQASASSAQAGVVGARAQDPFFERGIMRIMRTVRTLQEMTRAIQASPCTSRTNEGEVSAPGRLISELFDNEDDEAEYASELESESGSLPSFGTSDESPSTTPEPGLAGVGREACPVVVAFLGLVLTHMREKELSASEVWLARCPSSDYGRYTPGFFQFFPHGRQPEVHSDAEAADSQMATSAGAEEPQDGEASSA